MSLTTILEQAKALTPQERETLITYLQASLAEEVPKSGHSIMELRGLGKEIWQGVDAQAYVDQLRDEWDARP